MWPAPDPTTLGQYKDDGEWVSYDQALKRMHERCTWRPRRPAQVLLASILTVILLAIQGRFAQAGMVLVVMLAVCVTWQHILMSRHRRKHKQIVDLMFIFGTIAGATKERPRPTDDTGN